MTGLSRCGRQYPDMEDAYKAAEARTFKSNRKHEVWPCPFGEHWHVIDSSRTPLTQQRPDPFPPPVRKLLAARDECCQRCGFMGRLEAHHRRAKASGGSSARAHTQCACNGVLLCRTCHNWVHLNPRTARADGWIVLQSVSKPGSVPLPAFARYDMTPRPPVSSAVGYVRVLNYTTRGVSVYPTCEGGWSEQP